MATAVLSQSEWAKGMKTVYLEGIAETLYTFDVNGRRFASNEAVVAAALPHILREQWEEHFDTIAGFSGGTELISKLLQYFYTCEMTVSLGSLKPILQACKLLGLDHLMEACQEYLWNFLGPHNYISWWRFSTGLTIEGIRKRSMDGLLKELNQVQKCQEFRKLNLEQVVEFFMALTEAGQTPDQLFLAALTWLEIHDPKDADIVLNIIDVSQCSKECLRVIAEPRYANLIWPTAALQNTLFRACLDAQPSRGNLPKETDLKVAEPKQDFEKETLLDLTYPANQKFALKMIQTFQEFGKPQKYVDIIVNLANCSVKAHATVLAAASPYFQSLLRFPAQSQDDRGSSEITKIASERSESKRAEDQSTSNANIRKTDLSHLKPQATLDVLNYMYCNQINIPNSTLLDYIQASDFLRLDSLLDTCKKYAETDAKIEDNTCFRWISAHRSYNLPTIRARAMEFACKNFERLTQHDGLLFLGSEDFIELLNHPLLAPVSEKALFELIISWISCELDSRRQCLSQMLESKAMKQCVVSEDLAVKELLMAGSFSSSERDIIWETRCKKMMREFNEELSIQESEVSRLKKQVTKETSEVSRLKEQVTKETSEVSRLKKQVTKETSSTMAAASRISTLERNLQQLEIQLDQERQRCRCVLL